MEEVIVLDEIGILDEKLNLGGFSLSLRSLGILLLGGLFAYALIRTGRGPDQALGAIILIAAAVVGFYPAGAARIESTIIAMLHYYLYRRGDMRKRTQREKNSGIQHGKGEKKKDEPNSPTVATNRPAAKK